MPHRLRGDISECMAQLLQASRALLTYHNIKYRSIWTHDEVQLCPLHSTPPSLSSNADFVYNFYYRSGWCFFWSHVETPQSLTGSIPPSDCQLSRDIRHNCCRQFAIVLSDSVGLDKGRYISMGWLLLLTYSSKGWFDEGTRNKIHVLGKEPSLELLEIINTEDLPKPYGGTHDWKFEDEPKLDETAREQINEMPKGPVIFEHGEVKRPSVAEQDKN